MALGKRRPDLVLAITIACLVLFGIVMIYSSSVIVGYTRFFDEKFFFKRQIVWAILGFTAMIVMANFDYRIWKKWAGALMITTLVLLISVFLFSKGKINGAHRWIDLGPLSFQPSEFAKFTLLVYVSAWLTKQRDKIADLKETFLPYLGVLLVISILMLMQPDFGTLSIMLASAIAVYIVAGITWQQVLLGGTAAVAGIVLILAEPYRRDRLLTFLGSSGNSDTDYHINNIMIAIGSGGWFGLGFGASGQKRLFLPEPQTDSIFAIIVEELGFIVGLGVVAVLVFMLYRGFRIAVQAEDMFGRLLATGITTWFAFQAFINLASMLHIVPLVGVPLPFISYGGTNLLISMAAAGVLLNISRYAGGEEKAAPARARSVAGARRV